MNASAQQIADAPAAGGAALFARAQARLSLGREQEARTDFLACADELGDKARIELAHLDIRQRQDLPKALSIARGIIRSAPPESALSARALHIAGLAEGKLRRNSAAIDLLLKAAGVYRALKDFAARAQVFDTMGSLEAARGRLDYALHFFALSLVDKTLLKDELGMAITLGNIGRTHLRLGRFDDALDCFERDLQIATEIGDARGQARMHEDIGRCQLSAGNFAEAEAALTRCAELSAKSGYSDLAFFAHKDLGLLRIAQGKFGEAEGQIELAGKLLNEGAEPYLHDVLTAARGELALALNQPTAAEILEKSVNGFVAADLPDLEIPTRILLARALLKQKMKAKAEECLLKGMSRARLDGYSRYLPPLKQEMARLELSVGLIEQTARPIVQGGPSGAPAGATGDGYIILQRLGGGGFGDVFRAYDPLAARDVALKRFRLAKLYEVRRRKALITSAKLELEAASRVRHPGVVRIHAMGFDEEGELYLVSDFVEGRSLRWLMTQAREPAMNVAIGMFELIASALHALHEGGVVHRDLKPENVIVTADSLPVLVDFGIAHISKSDVASPNFAAGTPMYMSPEQARGAAVDGRTDLYALGVIAYEWLSGQLPIRPKGTNLRQISLELTATQVEPLIHKCPLISESLSELVMSMLQKNPSDRPASAAVVVDAFQKIARDPGRKKPVISQDVTEANTPGP